MPRGDPTAYISSRFQKQGARDARVGQEVEDEYLEGARSFDATSAARDAAMAQFDELSENLGENLEDLRGEQVGMGRLGTGFGFDDEDELYEGALRDLGRTLTQNALTTTEMNRANLSELGRFGERTSGRALDIFASERDAELQKEEQRRRDEAARKSSKFGFMGKVGGALLGPAGSVVGDRIADGLESLI